jgi:excisionase family DNA binding protein
MTDLVSISDAAALLGLSATRVRLMAAQGRLPAMKIGNRWVVERSAVEHRRREKVGRGRRFNPRNAWALLKLASGEDPPPLDPSIRSRLKKALALEGLRGLGPRLKDRALVTLYNAHPGEIPYVLEDEALMRSGISAAASLDSGLLSGREADGYVAQSQLKSFIAQHALSPAGVDGNVRLRVVPDDLWLTLKLDTRPTAPRAAVALDLAEEVDPRSRKAGENLIREIDRRNRN